MQIFYTYTERLHLLIFCEASKGVLVIQVEHLVFSFSAILQGMFTVFSTSEPGLLWTTLSIESQFLLTINQKT